MIVIACCAVRFNPLATAGYSSSILTTASCKKGSALVSTANKSNQDWGVGARNAAHALRASDN